jgi:hypothetical protein
VKPIRSRCSVPAEYHTLRCGSYRSAVCTPLPPMASTLPSASGTARCSPRGVASGAASCQRSATGSYTSTLAIGLAGFDGLAPPTMPPTTSTSPLARIVAVWLWRPVFIGAAAYHRFVAGSRRSAVCAPKLELDVAPPETSAPPSGRATVLCRARTVVSSPIARHSSAAGS